MTINNRRLAQILNDGFFLILFSLLRMKFFNFNE